MSKTVSTSTGNSLRTTGQASAGLLVVQVLEAFNVYDFNEVQTGLAVIVFGGLISFLQNAAENRGWIRAVLRTVPPTETKLVDDALEQPEEDLAPVPEQTDNRERDVDGDQPNNDMQAFTGSMR